MQSSLRVFAAAACAAVAVCAQSPIFAFSAATDQAATPLPVYDEEIHAFTGAGRAPLLTREMLAVLAGDANGNGVLDDVPADIDAIHATALPEPSNWLLSITADTPLAGVNVKDGDIFRFSSTGVDIVHPESLFEASTGTTNVDIDAFAVSPAGDLYFSFADDEATTIPALITQNGGASTLSKQCVFRLAPGASTATIHLTPQTAVAVFNQAFAATATTVVNVTDVEVDPASPGDLLLTCASTSAAFRGKVARTTGGGQPFAVGGQTITPAVLGLSSTASLDGLALAPTTIPPSLRSMPMSLSAATPSVASLLTTGWTPGEAIQLVATDAVFPRALITPLSGTIGSHATPLDVGSPMFAASFGVPAWRVTADVLGTASYSFDSTGIPAGITAIVQAFGVSSLALSTPAVVSFRP